MKKRKDTEESQDSGGWMVTFTNLMILLLAFFIVLVNMSVPDNEKKRVALNSLLGSFGLLPGGQSPIGAASGADLTMPGAPLTRIDLDLEQLQNITFANGLDSDVNITREGEKIIISLSDRILFEKGDHILTGTSADFLLEIGKIIKEGPGLIELRGYADKKEFLTDDDPVANSIFLSTKRSLSVLHFLYEKGEIPVDRLAAHGFGIAHQPEYSQLHQFSEWQGQVKLIVNYRQEVPYRLRIKKHKERILDFKGFLFKSRGSEDNETE